jgi:uncharacterized membrane protein YhaH (DUF805 family)
VGWKQLFFGFSGRISRKTYWLASLAVIAYVLIAAIVVAVLFVDLDSSPDDLIASAFLPLILLSVPLIYAGMALGVKRLHDRDKSGWWIVLYYWVPGALDRLSTLLNDVGLLLSVLAFAITIWGLVEIGFLRGTPGTNRYGPDPLGRRPDAAVPITH